MVKLVTHSTDECGAGLHWTKPSISNLDGNNLSTGSNSTLLWFTIEIPGSDACYVCSVCTWHTSYTQIHTNAHVQGATNKYLSTDSYRVVQNDIFSSTQITKSGSNFYCAKHSVARYCHDKLSDCLSVHPSVTLVDCDHTRWNSAKIISWVISLWTWLSADPNITDLFQKEHP